jgi:hypothetical protein
MVRKTLMVLTFTLASFVTAAQEADFILSDFFAVQVEERVYMRWTIIQGNTCEDTYIERSEDGASYERIGLIGGICGSPDQSITYDFNDVEPLPNRPVHYRLYLGQFGFSSPRTVEFVQYNDQGFLLAPNPFREQARLTFENQFNEEHSLVIIDLQGRVVAELINSDDSFDIFRGNLRAGAYYFIVSRNGQVIFDGRLMVL